MSVGQGSQPVGHHRPRSQTNDSSYKEDKETHGAKVKVALDSWNRFQG